MAAFARWPRLWRRFREASRFRPRRAGERWAVADSGYESIDIEDLDQLELIAAEAPNAYVHVLDGAVRVVAVEEADSPTGAVEQLVDAVHRGDQKAVPMRVELDLMAVSDIAALVGLNREAVRLWTIGKRGPGGFPTPLDVVGDRIKVWAASDVHQWLSDAGLSVSLARPLSPEEVTDANRAVERRRLLWDDRSYIAEVDQWHQSRHGRFVGTVPAISHQVKRHA